MIGTIRRHQQWLWGIIITATIVSFVIYFNPASRYGGGGQGSSSSEINLGSINGEPITPQQLTSAMKEGRLFFRLRGGAWPDSEEQKKQLQKWAEQYLVLVSLMNDYKITANTDAAARFAKQIFGVPPDQAMPLDKFNDWVQNELMRKGGLSLEDFDRFAKHQAGQEYLMSLFGMTGKLITSKEAEFFYRRENQPIQAESVSFLTGNYYSVTDPSEKDLQDFFTKHEAEYRLPDRVQINYVAFDASNYLAKGDLLLGTNVDEKVDEVYRQNGPDAFKDESGQPMTTNAAMAKIKKQMRNIAALQEARKDANLLLTTLSEGHDETHPFTPSDLEKVAKAKGLVVKTTQPFAEKDGSKDLDLPAKSLHYLFSLRDDAPDDPEKSLLYYSSALVGDATVYVAGLQKRIPSQLQPLSAVRSKVVNDFHDFEAATKAKAAGEQFATALQLGLMQGKSFDAVCAAQNVKPDNLPAFALTTTNAPEGMDRASFQQLQQAVFPLPAGESTKFIPTGDGGLVAYVKARLPVDEARMQQELPYYLARMREQRQIAAFQEWFSHQIQLRLIPPPGDQS